MLLSFQTQNPKFPKWQILGLVFLTFSKRFQNAGWHRRVDRAQALPRGGGRRILRRVRRGLCLDAAARGRKRFGQ